MPDTETEQAVIKTADDIIASDAFSDKLSDAIGKAIAAAMKPASDDKTNSEKLFAPSNQHAKPKIKSLLGATITAIYHGRNDPARSIEFAKARWGDGNEVQEHFTKALTSSTTGGAIEMVQTTVAAEVIEALRPASVVRSSGAQIVGNPTGTLQISRVATGAAISWVGEATATNATQQVIDTVTLTRKKGMIKVPVTKELILFSTPDSEQAIADDVVAGMAAGTDLAYISGAAGGDNPTGIRHQLDTANNLITATGVTAATVEADIASLMQAVRGANVPLTPEDGWFWMSSRSFTFLEKLRDANGNLIYPELRMETPRMMRYRVGFTNNISDADVSGGSPSTGDSTVYFGRGPSIMIADAQDMSLEVLENVAYTNSGGSIESGVDLDTLLVKAMLLTDIALRHTRAWAALEDVQWGA